MISCNQTEKDGHGLQWYTSSLLSPRHGMLCRKGGASASPYESLNLSFGVGDAPEIVKRNRSYLKQYFGIQHLVSAVQVHGKQIAVAENVITDTEFNGADAIITSQQGVGLLIQQADCQAILLHDPQQEVIAAIHSGWKGSTLNIIEATIAAMEKRFQVNPVELRAVISPSLGPCCAEFKNYAVELPQSFKNWQVQSNYFDFWAISRHQLTAAGLKSINIETTGICTQCNSTFYSYRRAMKNRDGVTGRNGSIIIL